MNTHIQKEQLFLELCLSHVRSVISIVTKFKTYELCKPDRRNKKSSGCATTLIQKLDSLHRF